MKLTRLVFCLCMITITLSMGIAPNQGAALSIGEAESLWTTDINPNPWSDHSRCSAVFARGQNWLYFDWTETSHSNPDIYLLDGANAVPIVTGEEFELGPRVLYYDDQFYLTYRKATSDMPQGSAYAVFLRTSSDGIAFGPETELFRPASSYIESHDILFANGWFYLAYCDLAYGDIFVVKSRNLVDWTSPVCAASTPGTTDFCPALCWAKGKIWLAWDYTPLDGFSTVWVTSSPNGVDWSEPTEIPPTEPYKEVWGPFSLIWSKGQFILATRAMYVGDQTSWRICFTASKDGITWSEYTLATSPSCEFPYYQCVEKGSVVFPLKGASGSDGLDFAIVFKRLQFYYGSSGERLFYGGIFRVIISV